MTTTKDTRAVIEPPLQGLAAYLRCEAGGVFVGHPAHATLMLWASEVDALTAGREALEQGEAVDCAYYSSRGACCESGEPCKADRHNDALGTHSQANEPALADHPDVRELRKWLNEGQTADIDRATLARVLALFSQSPSEPAPSTAGEFMTRKEVDDVVYVCREDGDDTTYDIVNTAIQVYLDTHPTPAALPKSSQF